MKLNDLLNSEFGENANVGIVSGCHITKKIAAEIVSSITCKGKIFFTAKKPDFKTLKELDSFCADNSCDILIGVGGGSVIDLCKSASLKRNLKVVIIPSVLSSDCISSPVAVLLNDEGKKISVPSAIPHVIVVNP